MARVHLIIKKMASLPKHACLLPQAIYVNHQTLYAYIGAGYGNRVLAWETIDGELVKNTDHSATGVAAELGAIGRLGQFAVSVGFQTVNFKYHELSAGIGFFF